MIWCVNVVYDDGEEQAFPFGLETSARAFYDRVKNRKDVVSHELVQGGNDAKKASGSGRL